MKYTVCSFYEDAEVEIRTDSLEGAALSILESDMKGVHAHLIDNTTGEVLALVNHPAEFYTPVVIMIFLSMMMEHRADKMREWVKAWEENISSTPEDELPAICAPAEPLAICAPAELPAICAPAEPPAVCVPTKLPAVCVPADFLTACASEKPSILVPPRIPPDLEFLFK